MALKPLHDAATIKRVVVATYQSVSGAGKAGMDELFEQSRNIFVGDSNEPANFTKQIAFNVIPHIDVFLDDGSTKEEWKMVVETKKILDPKIKVTATCVRVPVFVGHSEAVNIEFENEISAPTRRASILREAPGVMVVDKREDGGYVTPVECVGDYATFVSRIREDPTVENGLSPVGGQRQSAQGRGAERGPDRRTARPPALAESGLISRRLGLSPQWRSRSLLDQLQPREIVRVHLQPLERRDLVQFEQQIAAERVRDPALDEGDRDQPLAPGHRHDLVQAVGRIDDRLAGLELELQIRRRRAGHGARRRHNRRDR